MNKLKLWLKKVIHKPVSFRDHMLMVGFPIGIFCVVNVHAAYIISMMFVVYEIVEEISMRYDARRTGIPTKDRAYQDLQGVPVGVGIMALVSTLIDVYVW